eukprot:1261701-Amorphochlora_amoeboformis.AAC.1
MDDGPSLPLEAIGSAVDDNSKIPVAIPLSSFLVGSIKFELDNRYRLQKPLGHGAYGVLCSAEDTKTGEFVAIKKLRNIFDSVSEARRVVREVKLLNHLRHENIVTLIDIIS